MSIQTKNLCFAYENKQILRDLNLQVRQGERIGIMGVSGGGKSTLLKLLAGLYPPTAGWVEVQGERDPRQIRRCVAMVLQSAPLFPASIRDNITCGHPMENEIVCAACEAAQLTDWIQTLPDGLDTNVGERGGSVSGGQAQRINIARAIARNAPVILLDEATSALDDATGAAVLQALDAVTHGRTVVSVSHRQEALRGYDRVLQLEGGCLFDA